MADVLSDTMESPATTAGMREVGLFLERAVAAQALVAALEQLRRRYGRQPVQLLQQHSLQPDRHRVWVAVGAAQRLTHDLVDQAQLEQPRGGHAERLGGLLGLVGVLPQDRGAT